MSDRFKSILKTSLISIALIFTTLCQADSDWKSKFQLSFSSQEESGLPVQTDEKDFDCSAQIYTIISSSELTEDAIDATVIWRNPSGEIQEKTPLKIYPVEGNAFSWAWIKLHKATGASLLSFVDSSIGMEEFIGEWTIELLIDQKVVVKDRFNVLC